MMPAEAFDSPTQRKVLRVISEKNKQYTTEELGEMCHRSKSAISRALSGSERYPFITVDTAEGSKRKFYGMDSRSEYSEPIKQFFKIERKRERRNGTVPVDVWNLLEDITVDLEGSLDGFLELFLFGSYATGEYYAGSDLDLVLVVNGDRNRARTRAEDRINRLDPSIETQLLIAAYKLEEKEVPTASGIQRAARSHAPVSDGEPLIALWGDHR